MRVPIAKVALVTVAACTTDEAGQTPPLAPVPAVASTSYGAASPVHDQTIWVNPFDGQTYMRMGTGDMLMNIDNGGLYTRVGSTHAMNLDTGELSYMGGW